MFEMSSSTVSCCIESAAGAIILSPVHPLNKIDSNSQYYNGFIIYTSDTILFLSSYFFPGYIHAGSSLLKELTQIRAAFSGGVPFVTAPGG